MIQQTGYATIDQPWMQHHTKEDLEKSFEQFKNKTVWDVVEEHLEKDADIPMIEYFGNVISRKEFKEYVILWAKTFKALGIQEQEHIPLYVLATPESFAMFLAANAIGAIPYFQKLSITKEALEEETKEAKIAVVFDSMWPNVKDVFSERRFEHVIVTSASDSMKFPLKQITRLKTHFDNKKNSYSIPKNPKYIWSKQALKLGKNYKGEYRVKYTPNQIAVITTSSGTTSNVVKGIMDTNEGIVLSMFTFAKHDVGYRKGGRVLACFPPTASTSLNGLQLTPLISGCTIIFDPRLDTDLWYDQIIKYKPNFTITTGPVWEQFARDVEDKVKKGKKIDLSFADSFMLGGSGTTPEILNYINRVMKENNAPSRMNVGYGYSEVFGPICMGKKGLEESKDSSVISIGIPCPNYEVGIFDKEGNEIPYGLGKRGELWSRCNANMHGYYDKPEATKQVLVNGWIHSGDLCKMDKDGNVYCFGRLKNTIEINGKKVYLFDISNDLRRKFGLHDVYTENKRLTNGNTALNISFVQEKDNVLDSKELLEKIDTYLASKDIVVNGYKEYEKSLPIEPTTLKVKTKETDGFVKYVDGKRYDVSYEEVETDVYVEKVEYKKY